jgi:surface protein
MHNVTHCIHIVLYLRLVYINTMKKLLLLLSLATLVNCTKDEEVQKFTITLDSSDGGSLNIPSGSYVYDRMTIISFFAIPDEGYAFTGWTGAGDSGSQVNLVVIEDRNIVANFVKLDIYLAENGVTIKCPDANVGDTGTVNDKVYTVVDEAQLRAMISTNEDVTCVCTSKVTDLFEMFFNKNTFDQDIGSWDTSAVTNMAFMFGDASAFNQDISSWNTSKVTDMSYMFREASAFNKEISSWNTAAVTNMSDMFSRALVFNQDIGSWNTSKVTEMGGMFYEASAFNGDIGSWNTAAVTFMGSMFQEASIFNQDISSWNTSKVTDMSYMFRGASAFNQNLTGWCVTNITTEPGKFSTDSALTPANEPVWGTCP